MIPVILLSISIVFIINFYSGSIGNAIRCGGELARQPLSNLFYENTFGGGKSGLRRAECEVTPGGCEPTASAAESKPPKSLR